MQTKQDIAKEYKIDERGIVRSPGKFESEPWYVVALWDLVLNGCADREDFDGEVLVASFAIDEELAPIIGRAINATHFVSVWERDDGFVCHTFTTERALNVCKEGLDDFTRGYIECALWCGVMDERTECQECDGTGGEEDAKCDSCTDGTIEPAGETYSSDDLDDSDLEPEALATLTNDAHEFYTDNLADLRASTLTMERAGHDLWLTRNRHGAGFWDEKSRGKEADAALDRLTEASHAEGECILVLGDSGKVGVL
jgi:hypothetical protein